MKYYFQQRGKILGNSSSVRGSAMIPSISLNFTKPFLFDLAIVFRKLFS
jgi:hypothetical protein